LFPIGSSFLASLNWFSKKVGIAKIGFEVFARGELFKWRRECKFVDFYKLFYSQDLFFITILASLSELCYKFINF